MAPGRDSSERGRATLANTGAGGASEMEALRFGAYDEREHTARSVPRVDKVHFNRSADPKESKLIFHHSLRLWEPCGLETLDREATPFDGVSDPQTAQIFGVIVTHLIAIELSAVGEGLLERDCIVLTKYGIVVEISGLIDAVDL